MLLKLDIGQQGNILANVKLTDNKLNLQLVADNSQLLRNAGQYTQQLQHQLVHLGFDVNTLECKQGDVPKSLKHVELKGIFV